MIKFNLNHASVQLFVGHYTSEMDREWQGPKSEDWGGETGAGQAPIGSEAQAREIRCSPRTCRSRWPLISSRGGPSISLGTSSEK